MTALSKRRRGAVAPRRSEDCRGAAAVEFALVVPTLLLLVLGAIQYGLYFWALQGGSAAVREGARRAAVGEYPVCADFSSYVTDRVSLMTSGTPTVSRVYTDPAGNPRVTAASVTVGDTVKVKVSFDTFDLHIPLLPFIENGEVDQQADARVEYIAPGTPPGIC